MAQLTRYTPINNLKPLKTAWRIQVRILHSWIHFTKGSGMSLEMILADKDGNKIQAGIKKEHISKFQRYVKKGDWKIIEEFSVNKATGTYRSTTHSYRINFHYATVFSPSPSISNEVWLDLVDFTTILSGNLDQNKLVDVLGQLVNVGEAQIIDVHGKPTKKIDFQLRDTDDNRLPCSLWGKFADQISKVAQESLGSVVICLIRWAKLGEYKEIRSISNAFDASDVLVNPILPVVDDFRRMLPSDGLALTIMGPKPRFEPLKVREQRSLGLPLKTIAELKASYEIEKVKIFCTILQIDLDYSWYYYAHIKCNKKVFQTKKLLSDGAKKILNRCEKCNAEVSAVEARYWLHLDVMDNTGETKLMLFDSFVEKIIGTPAYELLEGTDEELDDPLPPPDVVKNIIGKTYQFVVSVEQENISRGNDEYKVTEVLTSQNLNQADPKDECNYSLDLSSMSSSDQVLMLTNNSDKEGTSNDVFSTPSSKRKEDFSDGSDQNSTSKKQCMEKQSDVKVDGVIDVENPKEHDLPKFINKLDEAGEQVITKASEEEQKKVLLKKIKVEKIEGQNGAK
ncbi:replication protein A 70 kDa DNA-binding subunit B [Arabidopsis lyrata subsp. lyrata]|uniref:replication protein A 70 kDa DNA-binding subunit B n=1 Tax=Arabidopsis lyrata subsp. lyrata TaxID=81972 RepID=UPI000A29C723|nr:replication protein A 70 kDa DNA-binding subunit B [Arabidopsis lyrata subsp. lyrata]|eukprot:XP_020886960.1 replication protein A 70 kDa DNA-binding subunit B [Arabidopsis lyrata subsp. lyrata]